jgi:hypothetical protein
VSSARLAAPRPQPPQNTTTQDPYRGQLEGLLSQHVAPLFASPHGHLRAKAAWLAKEFADVEFGAGGAGSGPLFNALLQAVINSLSDGCVCGVASASCPVRVRPRRALAPWHSTQQTPACECLAPCHSSHITPHSSHITHHNSHTLATQ